jgi:hypothetical protein
MADVQPEHAEQITVAAADVLPVCAGLTNFNVMRRL